MPGHIRFCTRTRTALIMKKRVIVEGTGVTEFTRLYIAEREGDEDFEISYWLYEEASGYKD